VITLPESTQENIQKCLQGNESFDIPADANAWIVPLRSADLSLTAVRLSACPKVEWEFAILIQYGLM